MQNNYPPATPQGTLKTIAIIHLALMAGQVLFALVTYTLNTRHVFDIKYHGDPFYIVAPLLAIAGFAVSNLLYKQQLGAAANKSTLAGKLVVYQTALIIRFALLEGPSLFCIVAFFLRGNLYFLGIAAALVLYFLSIRPTRDKAITDLNLSYDEQMELN